MQRPSTEDAQAWQAYWQAQGQPWRIKPEIDKERQEELRQRCAIVSDIKKGIYPFKGVKLSRADVEWLLATHESGGTYGPVDCSHESRMWRDGLDLRGTDLRQENLCFLPLARTCGGYQESSTTNEERRNMAAVLLEGAALDSAQLQEAHLSGARMQGASLWGTNLQSADLSYAQLQNAALRGTKLQAANLSHAQLQSADLLGAQLQTANLSHAQLQSADLSHAQLQGADLRRARLESTILDFATLSDGHYGAARLVNVSWGDTNLSVIDWEPVVILGDEQKARQKEHGDEEPAFRGRIKDKFTKLIEHKEAVRANRQMASVLQAQGLNEEAARFAYRARVLQKRALWYQMTRREVPFGERMQALGAWLFSWFLFLLAGYGVNVIT